MLLWGCVKVSPNFKPHHDASNFPVVYHSFPNPVAKSHHVAPVMKHGLMENPLVRWWLPSFFSSISRGCYNVPRLTEGTPPFDGQKNCARWSVSPSRSVGNSGAFVTNGGGWSSLCLLSGGQRLEENLVTCMVILVMWYIDTPWIPECHFFWDLKYMKPQNEEI